MQRFGLFERCPTIAVAVSGGSDSMALCLLAQKYLKARDGIVIALTVDHGLRSESAAEARRVGESLRRSGIWHHILTPPAPLSPPNLQAKAREARYDLLTGWCANNHLLHLLVGHQQDDQAETHLYRQERASTCWGLSGMPEETLWNGVRVLRPLLHATKAMCLDYLTAHGHDWVEDPSNRTMTYARNRIRASLDQQDALNALDAIAAAQRQRREEERSLYDALGRFVTINPLGFAALDPQLFEAVEEAVSLRLLSQLFTCIGGHDAPPRKEKLKRCYDAMLHAVNAGGNRTATLHHCALHYDGRRMYLFKELRRVQPVQIATGQTLRWDNRFEVTVNSEEKRPLIIDAIREGQAKTLHFKRFNLPARVLRTLPCLKTQENGIETVLCVPHIYHNGRMECRFAPCSPLAGLPFNWYAESSHYES